MNELRTLRTEKREVAKRVTELEAKVRRASTARTTKEHELRKTAVISLDKVEGRAGAVTLRLEYHVPGARWVPAYALQLDRARGERISATLSCRAMVCQRTGEDWDDVALTLTTADVQDWCEIPELQSIRIGRWQPPLARRGFVPPPMGVEELYADYDHARDLMPGATGGAEAEAEEPTARYGEKTIQAALAEADRWNDDHSVTHELSLPPAPGAIDRIARRPHDAPGGGGPPMQAPPPADPPPARAAPTVVAPEPLRASEYDSNEYEAPMEMASLEEGSASTPVMGQEKSAGLLSRFSSKKQRKVAVFRGRSEEQVLPDVLPPETPAETTLLPADELLAYASLQLPSMDHPRRGLLTVKTREEVYIEALLRQEIEVTFDVGDVVGSAWSMAQEIAALSPPRGHLPPRAESGFAYAYPAEARVCLDSDGNFHSIPLSLHSNDAALRFRVRARTSSGSWS